ncbi:bifunctional phosphopantothenoylcysteine decarboxylase/phosphopantothenate--cysteine ligase CoaBC [bacterium]|nr:MAG: bifunctional phosphopantothenoylcysteine decarboxylase/phosphopantothenate--cysteine ligase CoaBC [bacterium]
MLEGKKIVLGVSGSVAAYKSVYLGREILKSGAKIRVAMTTNATKFITPLTFRSALSSPVVVDEFAEPEDFNMEHISWSRWADLFAIAPATADVIAKAANGIADDFLTTSLLAAKCPVIFVPAMNSAMFLHPATQYNLRKLRELGYYIIEPEKGDLACGESGTGRFPEIENIVDFIEQILYTSDILSGKKFLITAGPTREYIDSVRFISNPSTGKMGFALAEMAKKFGADVLLISGPTELVPPHGVETIEVVSAEEMHDAVLKHFDNADIIIMASAVADYTPSKKFERKIKKTSDELELKLQRTPDILAELGRQKGDKILVGFALESDYLIENARKKIEEKNLDLIVANYIGEQTGFASDTNEVVLLYRDGNIENIPLMSKRELAGKIIRKIAESFKQG